MNFDAYLGILYKNKLADSLKVYKHELRLFNSQRSMLTIKPNCGSVVYNLFLNQFIMEPIF